MSTETDKAGVVSLAYVTFGDDPVPDAAALEEIRGKGFNTLIWQHTNASGEPGLPAAAAFSAAAARAGLDLWLNTSCLLPSPAAPEPDGDHLRFGDGEIADPAVLQALQAALERIKTAGCSLQGILVPVMQRLDLPRCWFSGTALLTAYEEKYGRPWPDDLLTARSKGPAVEQAVLRNYRRLLADSLSAAVKELKKSCAGMFGPGCVVQVYGGTDGAGLAETVRFDPVLAGAEQTELPHAEEVDRRPAPVIGRIKTLGGMYAAGSEGLRLTRIWGEDYGTQRASHSPDVLSYWTDLACTFHLNPSSWAFTPDALAFTRAVKKGVSFPAHPGWKTYDRLTRKMAMVRSVTRDAAGCARMGIVYPASSFSSFPERERAELHQAFHAFLYRLLRTGFVFEVIPDTWLGMATVEEKCLRFDRRSFTGIICPFARYMEPAAWKKLTAFAKAGGILMFAGLPPRALTDGTDIVRPFSTMIAANITPEPVQVLRYKGGNELAGEISTTGGRWGKPAWEAKGGSTFLMADDHPVGVLNGSVSYLGLFPGVLPRADLEKILNKTGFTRTVTYPSSAYLNMAADAEGLVLSLCPAEMNGIINGEVKYGNIKFEIIECSEVMSIRFRHGTDEIISHVLFGDTEVRVEH